MSGQRPTKFAKLVTIYGNQEAAYAASPKMGKFQIEKPKPKVKKESGMSLLDLLDE